MNNQAVDQYLCAIWDMYQEGSVVQKGVLLDQAEKVTKLTRKHLIKRLCRPSRESVARSKSSGRPTIPARRPGASLKISVETDGVHLSKKNESWL